MPTLDPVIVLAARYALSLLFLTAALSKLRHPSYFRGNLREYALLPGSFVPLVASVIPITELAIAAAVLSPATAPSAMAAAGGLLGLYALAMAINLMRGRRDIDCGCTGPAMRQTLNGWLVIRNGVLVVIALIGAGAPVARGLGPIDFFVCGFAVAGGALLYAAVNQLTANAPHLEAMDAYMEQP